MSYLRGDVYVWSCDLDDGTHEIHIWTVEPSILASGQYDPMWKSSVKMPMATFDTVVRRRALELGWTAPAVETPDDDPLE